MVQRVSPAPGLGVVPFVPPPWGPTEESSSTMTVKDGYLWTMNDPPGSTPEVVHHDAVVVHHDAVVHAVAHVSGTWSVADHWTNGVHFEAEGPHGFEFREVDMGEDWSPPAVASFTDPGGTGKVVFNGSTGLWSVDLPDTRPADPWMGPVNMNFTDASSPRLAVGSTSSGSGSSRNVSASVSVWIEGRVVRQAWDEVVRPEWDETVAPARLRRISYLGDY